MIALNKALVNQEDTKMLLFVANLSYLSKNGAELKGAARAPLLLPTHPSKLAYRIVRKKKSFDLMPIGVKGK